MKSTGSCNQTFSSIIKKKEKEKRTEKKKEIFKERVVEIF